PTLFPYTTLFRSPDPTKPVTRGVLLTTCHALSLGPPRSRHCRSETPPPLRYQSSLASTVSSAEAKYNSSGVVCPTAFFWRRANWDRANESRHRTNTSTFVMVARWIRLKQP